MEKETTLSSLPAPACSAHWVEIAELRQKEEYLLCDKAIKDKEYDEADYRRGRAEGIGLTLKLWRGQFSKQNVKAMSLPADSALRLRG
ncbi:MAG: hypothetical protein ABF384_18115 [Verrucomicrobiales bacterium]